MRIVYDPLDGAAVPESRVAEYVDSMIVIHKNNPGWNEAIGSPSIVDELRVRVVRGEISNLAFIHKGEELHVRENGTLEKWPRDFCCEMVDRIREISTARRNTK